MSTVDVSTGAEQPRPPPPDAEAEQPVLSISEELAILFPGRTVTVKDGGNAIEIKVKPMLVRHIRKFAGPIERAVEKLVADGVDFSKLGESWPLLFKHVAPLLLDDLFGLLNECTSADLNNVPHWILPDVADAWIEENFGTEEKLRPWFAVVSKVLERLGNEKVDLWATVSKALLRPGTTAETS